MKVNELYIIRHLRAIYGGSVSYKENCLHISIDGEKICVNLTPYFGQYIFSNKESNWILREENLAHGLFLAWCYKLHQELDIHPTQDDWLKFASDAYKYTMRSG